jgi:chromosome segregation ATPase
MLGLLVLLFDKAPTDPSTGSRERGALTLKKVNKERMATIERQIADVELSIAQLSTMISSLEASLRTTVHAGPPTEKETLLAELKETRRKAKDHLALLQETPEKEDDDDEDDEPPPLVYCGKPDRLDVAGALRSSLM